MPLSVEVFTSKHYSKKNWKGGEREGEEKS